MVAEALLVVATVKLAAWSAAVSFLIKISFLVTFFFSIVVARHFLSGENKYF